MVHSPPWRNPVSGPALLPQMFFNQDLDSVQSMAFAGGEAVFFTRRDPHKLTANEDAIALIPIGPAAGVIVVADGCGGQANGQLASRLAIEALGDAIVGWDNPNTLRAPILDGFETATRRVRELGTGAATTLIAIEINEGIIRTFHVGDSQALLVGGMGKVKLQTRSHSPVGYAVEAGMLTENAAMQHEDRHLVSNVIGTDDLHIDMGLPKTLDKRDTLIVGSDGLFDNLLQDEIVQAIRKGPIVQAAQRIAALVADRMSTEDPSKNPTIPCKPDDLSIVIFRQTKPGGQG